MSKDINQADRYMDEERYNIEPTTMIDESTQITIILEKDSITYKNLDEEGRVMGNDIRTLRRVIENLSDTTDTKGYIIIDKR